MTKINILTTFYTSVFDDLKNVIAICIVMSKSSDVWLFFEKHHSSTTKTASWCVIWQCNQHFFCILCIWHMCHCSLHTRCSACKVRTLDIICVFGSFIRKASQCLILLLEGHCPAEFNFSPTQNKPEPAIQGLQDYS